MQFWSTSIRVALACVMVICGSGAFAAEPQGQVSLTPEQASADPDFAVQGEYASDQFGVQVVALGEGKFRVVTFRGGLPGAGWDEKNRQDFDEDAAGVRELIDELKLVKRIRQSPTLGAKAPPGAVVLFGDDGKASLAHWKPGARVDEAGLLMPGCTSVETFGDFSLHIEFRIPFMPQARGQGRGNSGVYYQGRFETQMLDSFGLEAKDNDCGGLYSIKAPDVNMSFPPLSWQTYDVAFTAARWDDQGKKIASARVTVRQNGIVIQSDVELPKTTTAAPAPESPAPGPTYLQDHGNPVRYRNVWVVPRSQEQEGRRPIISGFERFHASGTSAVTNGRLLLGELNCTACHKATEALAKHMPPRTPPILDDVGRRVQPEYLLKFLSDPHGVKPGTTMPDLLAEFDAPERERIAVRLANFLNAGKTLPNEQSGEAIFERGRELFHSIGCIACHAPRDGRKELPRSSIPLARLDEKYTAASMAEFLKNPHKTRPSGRMPDFRLTDPQVRDIARYLTEPTGPGTRIPNLRYAVYHGSWQGLPDFDNLKPVRTGLCNGFDVSVADRKDNFGIRFEGVLNIKGAGPYQFHLGSDDGSVLSIDGKKVVDVDGVHPYSTRTERQLLIKGQHPVRVDYFQGGGEATLTVEYNGPGTSQQSLSFALVPIDDQHKSAPPAAPVEQAAKPAFTFDPQLAAEGKSLFLGLGCANCHSSRPLVGVAKLVGSKPLADLDPSRGCLAVSNPAAATAAGAPASLRVPRYDLNSEERAAIVAALTAPPPVAPPTPAESIAQSMTAFNCYACHARGKLGGPERDRNASFRTTIPEMGDEGRLPPALDGVGDKLNDTWMKHILNEGANDRPYMLTRMPKFGGANVGHLVQAFIDLDRRTEAKIPELTEPLIRVKAVGRQLVGDKMLACIKCHSFGPHRATGIQAINLQSMSKRLREDWFFRYIANPEAYRPGTRMPSGFTGGRATIQDVYHGDPDRQILAIWKFLEDGEKAGLPDGLIANVIELKPEQRPIIYRNFLEGVSSRGIAVGYPERAHLAWDADAFCLSLLWHGRFIDAGKHWEGRGEGKQIPLGDHVIHFEATAPLAVLAPQTPWPAQAPRERGYRFRGYTLDDAGRPHFQYAAPQFQVDDFPQPVPKGKEASFERRLTVTADKPVDNLFFRAAMGKRIEAQPEGWFLVDGELRVRVTGAVAAPTVRESEGQQELLIPVRPKEGTAELLQEIVW